MIILLSVAIQNRGIPKIIPRRKMRPSGIEPEAIAWEAMILPLNQERCAEVEKSKNINFRKTLKRTRGPGKTKFGPTCTSSL